MARLCLETGGGWVVVSAASGREALELALRERPDVLLLDVQMPGMDGPALLGALRQGPGWASTPVIFLTASTWTTSRE
ncbi:MAG: response regulator [Myxococcaceae bacterium]